MDCQRRPLFDLNEPPAEADDETNDADGLQPQIETPLHSQTSDSVNKLVGSISVTNNHAFSHASSVLGFQPFVRLISSHGSEDSADLRKTLNLNSMVASSSSRDEVRSAPPVDMVSSENRHIEREEGEWSDNEISAMSAMSNSSLHEQSKVLMKQGVADMCNHRAFSPAVENVPQNVSITETKPPSVSNIDPHDYKSTNDQNSEGSVKGDVPLDGQVELGMISKPKEVKGVEASHALRCANNLGKRHKLDHQKEVMLGKKRSRQTMFLKLEDVKQAGPIKTSTPRRQIPPPVITRTVKENRTIQIGQPLIIDQKPLDISSNEGSSTAECNEPKTESDVDLNSWILSKPRRLISATDLSAEANQAPITRQSSWKQPTEPRQLKNVPASTRTSALFNKKPLVTNINYQDTSVERLIRKVTNEKFWRHPEDKELQCVPGQFESVEEYVRVFEPLLFEECRAQLYSTWEESSEMTSRDAHVMVRIKSIEKRERGWYDVIVLPANDCKWTFKEGDVAVLSAPRPGSVRYKRNNTSSTEDDEHSGISGRVVGTVRRHIPMDTRDPLGAIIHFYVGDSFDSNSSDKDHILRKLYPKDIWYLTVLGSLATTQREYVALHAFRRLNPLMQTAILQPSPKYFPKYEEPPPAMPECFTPNFVDHLHKSFNGPQLSAIKWAAMHTAAGTISNLTKKQDPWPFTLVQGPPGTGKTHTVWGMLNVIHLVQYQHYYSALLKNLAPESCKQTNETNPENAVIGSIEQVLQNMDRNLLRTLPKLCPKPRMLVCAPSNAATDELLTRVLDRGFIDGEMKLYRPDVARVGVDTQTRAAQAVSVERRTEQLLIKSRDEIYGWLHQLRGREAHMSQQITSLQRELVIIAAATRSDGSVGMDPDVLLARDQNRDTLMQSLAAVVENRDKTLVEMSRLLILEPRFRAGSNFNLEEARSSLEASFANEAEIVFTTVSSSGRKLFSRLTHGFDMVVIDEAAQASEVGVLPPLALGAARCVLVGDPQQLPATVISKAAGTLLYSRSLFERFQQAGCPTILLSVQYRMHPQIRDFPSRYFYQGRLTDSESVVSLPDEVYYKDPVLRPYVFYDITYGRESHRGGSVSYQNILEAQVCVRLYEHLQKTAKLAGLTKISVGIITPYKLQLKCLQREFEDILNSEEGKDLYINTVDAFQGQERDVIIMSCVRASTNGVGFVSDIRRMNVALTRARRALWVMGNGNALVQSEDWAALITDAKARNCYMDMESLPKELLVQKGPPANASLPNNVSSNLRGFRSAGPRHRFIDTRMESKSSSHLKDDEKLNPSYISKNGNYRPMENSLDTRMDYNQSGNGSRDTWQSGFQKK